MDCSQIVTLVSNIVLAVFTGVLAFATIALWRSTSRYANATDKLVKVTESSTDITDQMAQSTKRYADATNRLVDVTKLSAKTMERHADVTKKSLNRQAALFALESYVSLAKTGQLVIQLTPNMTKFYERCEKQWDKLLDIAFNFDMNLNDTAPKQD